MTDLPALPASARRAAIVSGYFNPLHIGHLDMMEAARGLADALVVIVNNDAQQVLKKGKVITPRPTGCVSSRRSASPTPHWSRSRRTERSRRPSR